MQSVEKCEQVKSEASVEKQAKVMEVQRNKWCRVE